MDRADREGFLENCRAKAIVRGLACIAAYLFILTACADPNVEPPNGAIPTADIKSGYDFLSSESQVLQDDTFANPGYLWVEKGEEIFRKSSSAKACAECHNSNAADFKTAAISYPAFDEKTGTLVNLESRINLCRTRHQEKDEYAYESEELLALTSYIKSLSRGETIHYDRTDDLKPHFEAGKDYFFTRRGQLNLSCHQCHDQNAGSKMRGDTVSQGHINGFPAYRNDWQTLGSAHRRFEACDIGVRAQPMELGSQTYIDLEVYLKARGNGLTVETPAIRR